MSDVTQLLAQIESGDQQASQELLPLVYDELRKLAAAWMASERPDHTLQATALVHEAYVRLVDIEKAQHWNSRGHFFGAAAEAMRRILVDRARRKARQKHGGGRDRIDLDAADLIVLPVDLDLLALDDALTLLASQDPRKVELVKLRYFTGLTIEEAAEVLGISRGTADRDWAFAKAWLFAEIEGGSS